MPRRHSTSSSFQLYGIVKHWSFLYHGVPWRHNTCFECGHFNGSGIYVFERSSCANIDLVTFHVFTGELAFTQVSPRVIAWISFWVLFKATLTRMLGESYRCSFRERYQLLSPRNLFNLMSFGLICMTWNVLAWCFNARSFGLDWWICFGMRCETFQICAGRSISEELGCTCVSADTFQFIEAMSPIVQSRSGLLARRAAFLCAHASCNVVAFAFCMALLLVKMLPLWCAFAWAQELQHVHWVLAICLARQFWARIFVAQFLARVDQHLDYHRFRLIC